MSRYSHLKENPTHPALESLCGLNSLLLSIERIRSSEFGEVFEAVTRTEVASLGLFPNKSAVQTRTGRWAFFFLGRPLFWAASDAATIAIWHLCNETYFRSVNDPDLSLLRERTNLELTKPVLDSLSLVLPASQICTFETDFSEVGKLALKSRYRLTNSGAKLSEEGANTTSRLTVLPENLRNLDCVAEGKHSSGVAVWFFCVNQLSEIAFQTGEGKSAITLKSLGIKENDGNILTYVRSKRFSLLFATDANRSNIREVDPQYLLELVFRSSVPICNKLEMMAQSENGRSNIRHTIRQDHDQIEGLLRRLVEPHHIDETDPLDSQSPVAEEMRESLFELAQAVRTAGEQIDVQGKSSYLSNGRKAPGRGEGERELLMLESSTEVQRIDLTKFVTAFFNARKDRGASLNNVPPEIYIKTNLPALEKALSELVSNAAKYSLDRRIEAKLIECEGDVILTLSNIGPQVGAREHRFLTSYGFRGRAAIESGVPGSGRGLALAKEGLKRLRIELNYEINSSTEGLAEHCVSLNFPSSIITSSSSD